MVRQLHAFKKASGIIRFQLLIYFGAPDDDVCAALRKTGRRRAADHAGAARDQHNAILHIDRHVLIIHAVAVFAAIDLFNRIVIAIYLFHSGFPPKSFLRIRR